MDDIIVTISEGQDNTVIQVSEAPEVVVVTIAEGSETIVITIDEQYVLPTASSVIKGGIKVGSNLKIEGEFLSALVPRQTSELINDSGFITEEVDPVYMADKPNIALRSEIPNELSDLLEDVNHRTVTDTEKAYWNAKLSASSIGTTVQPYDSNTVIDSSYVHTDNNFTDEERAKLAGIENAITIGIDTLLGAISTSTLKPMQWYLIEDYQTIGKILSSDEYYIAPVEQIYVLALDVNKVSPVAYSKTYPDELLTFDSTKASCFNQMSNSGGSESSFSAFDITAESQTELYLNTDTLADFDNVENMLIYFEFFNNPYGVDYSNYSQSNLGDTWTFNPNANILELLKVNINMNDEYSGGESGFFSIAIEDDSSFTVEHPEGFNIDEIYEGYIYANDGSSSYEFNSSTLGIEWTFINGLFTDLIGDLDFTSEDLYMELIFSSRISSGGVINLEDGFYCEMTYDYPSGYVKKGLIIGRENVLKKIKVDIDYRGRKFRRYKPATTEWVAGSYAEGQFVTYLGTVYLCLENTSESLDSVYWMQVIRNDYLLPNTNISSQYTLLVDLTQHQDFDMFNMDTFDSNNSRLDVVLKSEQGMELDAVIQNITNCKNSTITGYLYTLDQYITDSNIKVSSSYLRVVERTNITYGYMLCCYALRSVTASKLKASLLGGSVDSCDIGVMLYTLGRTTIQNCPQLSLINGAKIRGSFADNEILSLYNVDIYGNCSGNNIQTLQFTKIAKRFENNTLKGANSYINFLGDTLRNISNVRMYGSSNSARTTYGYLADNLFESAASLNYFPADTNIYGNRFMSGMSNMYTQAVPASNSNTIAGNTFMGSVNFWNGGGILKFEHNNCQRNVSRLTSSNAYPVLFRYNTMLGRIGDVTIPVTFLNNSDCQITYNTFIANIQGIDFYNIQLNNCRFLGSIDTYGASNSKIGNNSANIVVDKCQFNGSLIGATLNKSIYRLFDTKTWTNVTINADTDQTTLGNFNNLTRIITNTDNIIVTDHTIICNKSTAFTVTLPVAVLGQEFIIKNIGVGVVTVEGYSSNTIDGALNTTLNQWDKVQLQCYANNSWIKI